jgi:hypothetical protein
MVPPRLPPARLAMCPPSPWRPPHNAAGASALPLSQRTTTPAAPQLRRPMTGFARQLQMDLMAEQQAVQQQYLSHALAPSAPPPELMPLHPLSPADQGKLDAMQAHRETLEERLIVIVGTVDTTKHFPRGPYDTKPRKLIRLGLLFRDMHKLEGDFRCGSSQEQHYNEWKVIAAGVQSELAGERHPLMLGDRPPPPVSEQEEALDFLLAWRPLVPRTQVASLLQFEAPDIAARRRILRRRAWSSQVAEQ